MSSIKPFDTNSFGLDEQTIATLQAS